MNDPHRPALDPDAAARVAAFGPPVPIRDRGLQAVRDAIESAPPPTDMPTMADIGDAEVAGPGGRVPVRIYRPANDGGPCPVIVHLHGGGLVMGSNRSFEPMARAMAAASGAAVVAVDYRLAPENPPPAQFEDAWTVTKWVAADAERLRFDPGKIVVSGDSAGGGLAAAVTLAARDEGGPRLFAQVLMYPGLDRDMAAPSILANPHAPMLTHDDIVYLHELADIGAGTSHDTRRVPAYATDLTGLPQAIMVTGELDPISDWGERYAARLRDAGVQTTVTRYPGIYHGFLMRSEATARGRLAMAEIGALLRAKFANPLPFTTPLRCR
ncbi:alpha/beta hydrolase [Mycolicibacterium vanbaalenii]|uniref:Alpha/beta hydrolase fold-3 domain protein n=1 Tax=Mycolicibacterium vanbaalenii (strain DSM 7251 / JCM 13017 / BCRC 16820 / KCTC 9966 / NRRL B-24157 / PYR-1) TaxID=350058 RepID=A1T928_MYCVP|nr:alpha/beta hydrolase [Mycolicibacterium vanbaalenii]ABM13678.1 Alpha/beta hydrolase fold-3 domain protein [Mycolicibacterium vanbaalenii PYR-1]MCV7126584.1 alpha/beta hydrolase [Mycolicibacterium vanbaalenii PYR-1]